MKKMKALTVLLLLACLQQSNGSKKPNQPSESRTRSMLLAGLACCQILADQSKNSSTPNSICKFNQAMDVNPFINYADQDRPFFVTGAKDVIAFSNCVNQDEKFFDKYLTDASDYKSCLEKNSILEYPLKFGKKAYECAKSYLFSGEQASISQKDLFAEYLNGSELEGEARNELLETLEKNLEKERVETLEAERVQLEKIETEREGKVKLANMEIDKANKNAENLKKNLEGQRESKFDFFELQQATKFFSYQFPDDEKAAVKEALKEWENVDFEGANRALIYAEKLYPNERSQAIKNALQSRALQHKDFGRLLKYTEKLRPNDEVGTIKLAMKYEFSLRLGWVNFDHVDQIWKLYVKHQSHARFPVLAQLAKEEIMSIQKKAVLATLDISSIRNFARRTKDVDFNVVERLMKIMFKVHPRTQEGYHQAMKMGLEQYLENEQNAYYDPTAKTITAENIKQVEETVKMFHEMCINGRTLMHKPEYARMVYKFAVGKIREDKDNTLFTKIKEAYKETQSEWVLFASNWTYRDRFWKRVFGYEHDEESFYVNDRYDYYD